MADVFGAPARPRTEGSLLEGRPGGPGFVFHDGHNQPVHRAAPGLLGLIEARLVIARWKPRSLAWLDGTDHFFDHIFAEFDGFAPFEAVRREFEDIRDVAAPWGARNVFLFRYLHALTRELERAEVGRWRRTRAPAATGPDLPLNGTWTVRYCSDSGWAERDVTVPVNWELVPGIDNYAGTMRFTRTFVPPAAASDAPVTLRFSGVDYFADVWVNGYHLGGHEGYFAPFEFDVSPYLRDDDNIVRVAVTSPNDPSGTGTHVTSGWHDFSPGAAFPNRKTVVKGTLGHHDARRGGAWSAITSQDGNTGGIWNDVVLRVRSPVHADSAGPRVVTQSSSADRSSGEHRAAARTTVTVHNRRPGPVPGRVRVLFEPANFEGPAHELAKSVRLAPGRNEVEVAGTLAPVRLWHPIDQGFPHLYTTTVVVEVDGDEQDRESVETGFRTLSVSAIGESTGPDGAFVVNGGRVFVRGTNLLPTYWLSEYSDERVDRDFEMLREAGFNAVLVHNLVAPKRFYERANRNGFLVVQMFPLQWSYEQSQDMVDRMTAQLREMAALLVNEPSVVSYEVHNEPDMRTFEDVDNRLIDFELHAVVREADPTRWATTFSSGNHAYPGQFYPLRDDNSFATLPARFLEEEVHGRRISRHRNMPTEFGIQAMPHVELFRELVSEERVRSVLERIRTDPKWLAAGGEGWEQAAKTIDEARDVLGDGSWSRALDRFDWSLLWDLGQLGERIRRISHANRSAVAVSTQAELASLKLAVLLLDVLHYGGFKGENFWFGLWKPASTLEGFVRSGQDRQYRLHKDAIEHYLNAGVTGPIVGYFSFMFRDADWQAPTWGVVDAAWVPKNAYRAYLESNHPVRVTLPQALAAPVKLPGDPWWAVVPEDRERFRDAPWAGHELIVANDTDVAYPGARVEVWVEDAAGRRVPSADHELRAHVGPASGWTSADAEHGGGVVPEDLPAGTYFLRAAISTADGRALSTNTYELVVPDTTFGWLDTLPPEQVSALVGGAPSAAGFHYWHGGTVAYRAAPGVGGLVAGWHQAQTRGIDLYETVQGEHLFRHLLAELDGVAGAERLLEDVWTIRSEVVSPIVKNRTLLRYAELFVRRAEGGAPRSPRRASSPPAKSAAAAAGAP
ncbi:MAG: beta galactosidase jelly roll domain-containing protein, partial [Actinomycetota bacterium]|nr:beta galactosidase jelly roll domain-containing protein [Actinomycetota bacterium]